VEKSAGGLAEHVEVSVWSVVSAKEAVDPGQSDEQDDTTKQPRRPASSSDHQFLCPGIEVGTIPIFAYENGYWVRQDSDGSKRAKSQ
jgi:hypothetical protein